MNIQPVPTELANCLNLSIWAEKTLKAFKESDVYNKKKLIKTAREILDATDELISMVEKTQNKQIRKALKEADEILSCEDYSVLEGEDN